LEKKVVAVYLIKKKKKKKKKLILAFRFQEVFSKYLKVQEVDTSLREYQHISTELFQLAQDFLECVKVRLSRINILILLTVSLLFA